MKHVGAFEAKNRLGTLLDWVEQGEEVVITRHGKPIARLVASPPAVDRDDALSAVASIRNMRRGVTLGGLTLTELVNDGRL